MMVHLEYNHHANFIKIKGNQWSVASKNYNTKDLNQPTIGDSLEKAQPLLDFN